MSEHEQQTEAADGQSRLTDMLEGSVNNTVNFHFYSFSYEGVRAAVKNALEFLHFPSDGCGIDIAKGKREVETKDVDKT